MPSPCTRGPLAEHCLRCGFPPWSSAGDSQGQVLLIWGWFSTFAPTVTAAPKPQTEALCQQQPFPARGFRPCLPSSLPRRLLRPRVSQPNGSHWHPTLAPSCGGWPAAGRAARSNRGTAWVSLALWTSWTQIRCQGKIYPGD